VGGAVIAQALAGSMPRLYLLWLHLLWLYLLWLYLLALAGSSMPRRARGTRRRT